MADKKATTALASKATVLNLKKSNAQPPSAKSNRSAMSSSQQSMKSLKAGIKPKSTASGVKEVPPLSSYEAIDPLHKEVRNPMPLQTNQVIAAPDKNSRTKNQSDSNLMTPKSPGSMVRTCFNITRFNSQLWCICYFCKIAERL